MTDRPRCGQLWMAFPADRGLRAIRDHPPDWHACARPPVHPLPCMCHCGDRKGPP